MKLPSIIKSLILIFFLLLHFEEAFARAGGGGRSGGGGSRGGGGRYGGWGGRSYGGYSFNRHGRPLTPEEKRNALICVILVPLVFFSYTGIISYLYFTKGKRNKKKIEKRKTLDGFWDHDKIIDYSKDIYVEVQTHWSGGSLKDIETKLTPSLFRQQQSILKRYKKRKLYNRVEDITIEKAGIIYFDDYIDNSKDLVAVLIEGEMKDFFGLREDAKLYEKEKFRDAFVFLRNGNGLLLHEIINEPDKYEIATVKNSIE